MSRKGIFFLIVSFLLALLVQVSCAADTAEPDKELLAKIITAYGGEKVIGRITGVYAAGDIEAFMRADRGSYELFFKRPRKLRVETKYDRSSETRILNGDTGFRGSNDSSLTQVRDYRLLAMVYQYKHFDLPYGLLKGDYSVSRKGVEVLGQGEAEVLRVTDAEGPPMDVYVDTKSLLIVKVTGHFIVAGGRSAELSSEFSDFRKVGDAVFPFRMISYAGGQKIAEMIMKTYRINPEMKESLFSP